MTKQEALPFIAGVVFIVVGAFSQIMAYLNENGSFPNIREFIFLHGIEKDRRALIILRFFCLAIICFGVFQLNF